MSKKELKCSASVPSFTHSYSIATEFATRWFLHHFSKEFFKTIHIEGKSVLDDYRKFDFHNLVKKGKPALAILPRISFDYNRDMQDTNMFGLEHIMGSTDVLERAFFKNFDTASYISLLLDQIEIRYTYKIRVETRAQQIDLYKYMNMAFRVSHNETVAIDADFHIPYGLMLQLASDNKFIIEDNKIKDIVGFLAFVNSKSELPITFKLRTINHHMEFFLRFQDIDIQIDLRNQLSLDDGERQGMLDNNFHIEMEVAMKLPSPKLYLYYSTEIHDYVSTIGSISAGENLIYDICSIELTDCPLVNAKGWNQYLSTDYYEENIDVDVIELEELFNAMDCNEIIAQNNKLNINSNIFIDFKIFNANEEVSYSMDWSTMKMTLSEKPKVPNTRIYVYMDTVYYAEQLDVFKEIKKSRLY